MSQHNAGSEGSANQSRIMQQPMVPLPVEAFHRAYMLYSAGLQGKLPPDITYPKELLDVETGQMVPFQDTPMNRVWLVSSGFFENNAEKMSFGMRVQLLMQVVTGETGKYRKHVNREAGTMHIALWATIAQVPLSARTTAKALRAAFAAEFRKQMARAVGTESDHPLIH